MKITVFTGNQPRHLSLLRRLSAVADKVYAVQECNTVFPGQVKDFFNNTAVMQEYFSKVMAAEKEVFGEIGFLPANVYQLAIKSDDLNRVSLAVLDEALQSEVYIVFGSSFIKGDLIRFLVEKRAINIHMGISPYFRGSSCNFWAPYTGHPELIGATIHLLSEKLDAGDMLYHALPKPEEIDLFRLGMKSVLVAHQSLADRIADGKIFSYQPVAQDKSLEMKYTRNADFTDEVAEKYLKEQMSPQEVLQKLEQRDLSMLLRPYIG